jgi:hypothetical protein
MNRVIYNLRAADGTEHTFEIDLERNQHGALPPSTTPPEWTLLEFQRCTNCPYESASNLWCPTALDIVPLAEPFTGSLSIDRVDVWVHTAERSYFKNCDLQTALKSLFGLVMASSACPHMARLKPLAYFHLPFATLEETVHRTVGAYLVNQYITQTEGKKPDWDLKNLEGIYSELRTVNTHFMKRLRKASTEDANINALQTFVSISSVVEMGLDDMLEKMVPLLKKGL